MDGPLEAGLRCSLPFSTCCSHQMRHASMPAPEEQPREMMAFIPKRCLEPVPHHDEAGPIERMAIPRLRH